MRDISSHILDICENSVSAGASLIEISLAKSELDNRFTVTISDNGCGMPRELLEKVTSPFTTTRTTRKVGLGIPLFKAGCENTGGHFSIQSKVGCGTIVKAEYVLNHIDRPPLGELAETIHSLVVLNPQLDFELKCVKDQEEFLFSTQEVKSIVGDIALNQADVSNWILEYLREGILNLFGGNQI